MFTLTRVQWTNKITILKCIQVRRAFLRFPPLGPPTLTVVKGSGNISHVHLDLNQHYFTIKIHLIVTVDAIYRLRRAFTRQLPPSFSQLFSICFPSFFLSLKATHMHLNLGTACNCRVELHYNIHITASHP